MRFVSSRLEIRVCICEADDVNSMRFALVTPLDIGRTYPGLILHVDSKDFSMFESSMFAYLIKPTMVKDFNRLHSNRQIINPLDRLRL